LIANQPSFFYLLSLEEGFITTISRKLLQKLLLNHLTKIDGKVLRRLLKLP